MGAFSSIDSSQGDWAISRTLKIRQPLSEVLAGGDAVLRHAFSPPCVDVEVLASRLQRSCPHLEGCPGAQGQGSPIGGIGCMLFEGSSQVFAIHDVQYGAPRAPAFARQDGPVHRLQPQIARDGTAAGQLARQTLMRRTGRSSIFGEPGEPSLRQDIKLLRVSPARQTARQSTWAHAEDSEVHR